MANCFGDVIDNFKLDTMPRYVGKPKTQEDRAREAENLKNSAYKDAYDYVHGVKGWYGPSGSNSTLCLVYNQTGDTLYYVDSRDWEGSFIGRTPYPAEIGNGQWAAFHHVHKTGTALGSEGAVVYRGKDKNGRERDFLLGWRAPTRPLLKNKAYCAILDVDGFQSCLGDTMKEIEYSGYVHLDNPWDTCWIKAEIPKGYDPVFTATISTIPLKA